MSFTNRHGTSVNPPSHSRSPPRRLDWTLRNYGTRTRPVPGPRRPEGLGRAPPPGVTVRTGTSPTLTESPRESRNGEPLGRCKGEMQGSSEIVPTKNRTKQNSVIGSSRRPESSRRDSVVNYTELKEPLGKSRVETAKVRSRPTVHQDAKTEPHEPFWLSPSLSTTVYPSPQ